MSQKSTTPVGSSEQRFESHPVQAANVSGEGVVEAGSIGLVAQTGVLGTLVRLVRAMRPLQWTKNALVFAALVFDLKFFDLGPVTNTLLAFVAFCLASSSTYLINDIRDIAADQAHPRKRHRPLASGALSIPVARWSAGVLVLASLGIGWLVRPEFAGVVLGYLLLMKAYNLGLKQQPIIDVMVIAFGFVLRAAGGAVALDVPISPWLYVCTALLSIFLGLAKRRSELASLGLKAEVHRANLSAYTVPMLDQMISMIGAATMMAYAFYTFEASTVPSNYSMMLTLPFVVFAIFRYLLLIQQNQLTGSPELLLFRDRPLFISIVGWGISAVLVLYFLN